MTGKKLYQMIILFSSVIFFMEANVAASGINDNISSTSIIDTNFQCKKEVSKAYVREIRCPKGRWLNDFFLGPDNNEIIVLLTVEIKELYIYKTTNFFSLDEYIPGGHFKRKRLNSDGAKKTYDYWRALKEKVEGVILKEYQEYFMPYAKDDYRPSDDLWCHFEKREYWKYKIKEDKWIKVDWRSGSELMKNWQELKPDNLRIFRPEDIPVVRQNAIFFHNRQITPIFNYGIKSRNLAEEPALLFSPDGTKVIYRPILKKGKMSLYANLLRRFNQLAEKKEYFLMGLGLCCVNAQANKVFDIVPENHKILFKKTQWAHDGSFLIFSQSRYENEESPDLLNILYVQ